MAKYRKIDPRIWHDEKFNELSQNAKFVFVYLLTSPHSTPWGCYVIDNLYIQADTGMSASNISNAVSELLANRLILRCEKTRLVAFPKWFDYNPPANQKSAIACINGIKSLPRSPLIAAYIAASVWLSEQLANGYLTGLEQLGGEQEQEQEQEQDKDTSYPSARTSDEDSAPDENEYKNDPVFIEIILNDKSTFPIRKNQVCKFQELYQAIDVREELRKCAAWNLANRTKRKTKNGILRHVNGWLSRAQDNGGNGRPPKKYLTRSEQNKIECMKFLEDAK